MTDDRHLSDEEIFRRLCGLLPAQFSTEEALLTVDMKAVKGSSRLEQSSTAGAVAFRLKRGGPSEISGELRLWRDDPRCGVGVDYRAVTSGDMGLEAETKTP